MRNKNGKLREGKRKGERREERKRHWLPILLAQYKLTLQTLLYHSNNILTSFPFSLCKIPLITHDSPNDFNSHLRCLSNTLAVPSIILQLPYKQSLLITYLLNKCSKLQWHCENWLMISPHTCLWVCEFVIF